MKKWNLRVSPSSYRLADECMYRFWASYIEKAPPDVVDKRWSVLGSAVHDAIKVMYKENRFEEDFLLEVYPVVFDQLMAKEDSAIQDQILTVKSQGPTLMHNFYEAGKKYGLLSPPLYSEQYFRVPYKGIYLTGKIDLIFKFPDGRIFVIDFKTSKYELSIAKAKEDIQLTFYSWGCKKQFNVNEDVVAFLYLRTGNLVESTRSREDYLDLAQKILDIKQKIELGKFEPSYKGCRFCDHKKLCEKNFGSNWKRNNY